MTNKKIGPDNEEKHVNQGLYFILGCWGLWLVLAILFAFVFRGDSLQGAGQFGDWFGALNTLFSGCALLFIGINLWRTRRSEIDQDRRHERQRFADHFFQLLDSFQSVVNQTTLGPASGRRAFINLKHELYGTQRDWMTRNLAESRAAKTPLSSEILDAWYGEFYKQRGSYVGHYFRLLYHILLYVDTQDDQVLDAQEKYRYVRLVRAHLSQDELELLFFNALHSPNRKMHPLIEKYDFLQNLVMNDMITENEFRLYPESAAKRLAGTS